MATSGTQKVTSTSSSQDDKGGATPESYDNTNRGKADETENKVPGVQGYEGKNAGKQEETPARTINEILADGANGEIDNSKEDNNIVMMSGGKVAHGPMPASEWAKYSREHGL